MQGKTNKGWAGLVAVDQSALSPDMGTCPIPEGHAGVRAARQCAGSQVQAVAEEEHAGQSCLSSQELRFLPFTALLHVLSRMSSNGETGMAGGALCLRSALLLR